MAPALAGARATAPAPTGKPNSPPDCWALGRMAFWSFWCRLTVLFVFQGGQGLGLVSWRRALCAWHFLSGRRVKGETTGRMRSAGRSPSTERARISGRSPALDAAGTIHAPVMGAGGFKAVGRPPAPMTTEGDSLPFPAGRGGGNGRALHTWALVQRAGRRLPFLKDGFLTLVNRCRCLQLGRWCHDWGHYSAPACGGLDIWGEAVGRGA